MIWTRTWNHHITTTQLSQHGSAEGTLIYKLNADLKQILKWSKKWKVEFAPEKTIHVRIAKKRPPDNKNYQNYGTKSKIVFNYTTIPRSQSHRVLGVIFEDNLTFNEQANKVYKKMQNRLFLFRRFLSEWS